MSVVTPTTPTVSTLITAEVIATATLGTRATLDVRTKWGADLLIRIGRRAATALTTSCRVLVRRTHNNDGTINPNQTYDCVSSIATAASTTVASGGASGSNTVTLTSGTGFAAGDIICLHSDDTSAARVEFARVSSVSGAVLTVDANFKTSHSAADRVTNQADVFSIFIPRGHTWEVRGDNGAGGQSVLFEVLSATYDSDTIT